MSLSICLAARSRPDLLGPTLKMTLSRIRDFGTRIVVCLDDNDTYVLDELDKLPKDDRLIYDIRPQEDSLGEKYNRVLEVAPADVYLVMVDYAHHTTTGFDSDILHAATVFLDGIGVIYNDMANLSFPQMNAVTHRLAELMGGIYPPWFPYWFVDHWLDDIARMIGRMTYVDVGIDTFRRPGTRNMREAAFWATFYDALKADRREIAERIFAAPDFIAFPWQKELLRSSWPLIEQRSDKINDGVRAAGNFMGVPADDRYRRIKARAVEKLQQALESMEKAA